jgi:hypothetical protein
LSQQEINMLEIVIVWALAKKIAAIARRRGRAAAGYVVLFIFSWLFGEFAGAVCGAIAAGGEESLILYVFALAGAAAGALFAFVLVSSLPDVRRNRRDSDGWDGEAYDWDYARPAGEKPVVPRTHEGQLASEAYRSRQSNPPGY